MLKQIIVLTGLILVIISSQVFATVDLQLEQSISVPGLTGTLREIDFNDFDNDGNFEVAASNSSTIVVYSPHTDEIIFSSVIDTNYYIDKVIYEDANHDNIPDIVILGKPNFFYSFTYLVQLFDGASEFEHSYSETFHTPNTFGTFFPQVRELDVIDWNNDGYNNLIFSYDSISTAGDVADQDIVGRTYTYHSFPDSVLKTDYDVLSLSNPIGINPDYELGTFIATRHTGNWDGVFGGYPFFENKGVVLGYDDPGHTIDMIKPNQCSGEMGPKPINSLSPQCAVEFDLIITPLIYIISYFEWQQECLSGVPSFFSGSEIVAHSLIESDNSFLQWSIPNDGYYSFMAHSSSSEYFYAISSVENAVIKLRVADGDYNDRSGELGDGIKFWDEIYKNEIPRLVIIENLDVEIYKFGTPTDIEDDVQSPILPTNFTLSQPYPNPFNATLSIPLKLDKKAHTTIEAFNLLGQKVDNIYEGILSGGEGHHIFYDGNELSSGRHLIQWDANKFSSGVYLIRVNVDDESQTVKAVLLK